MKLKWREKYIHVNYQDKLVYQWQIIHQGNKRALEYVTQSDELIMACGLKEDHYFVKLDNLILVSLYPILEQG